MEDREKPNAEPSAGADGGPFIDFPRYSARQAAAAELFRSAADFFIAPCQDAIMTRATLGAERVADPLTETYRALHAALEQKGWSDGNWDPVSYYYDRMICNWLLQLIDNALSDVQLEAVQPAQVHLIVLLLFRDMFRHHSGLLRPAGGAADWIEPLFQEVASDLRLAVDSIQDNGQPYELDDMKTCGWAKSLAAAFGLPAEKLFVCHSAIVTGITEEFGSDQSKGSGATLPKKPWWRFW